MENQTQTSEVATTPDTSGDQPLIITLADLDLLRQIIDLASSRGAFKGPELNDVGRIYNKLSAFINLAAAQSQTEQEVANPAPQDNSSAPSAEAPSQGE
jgi:hypothetical protein